MRIQREKSTKDGDSRQLLLGYWRKDEKLTKEMKSGEKKETVLSRQPTYKKRKKEKGIRGYTKLNASDRLMRIEH